MTEYKVIASDYDGDEYELVGYDLDDLYEQCDRNGWDVDDVIEYLV